MRADDFDEIKQKCDRLPFGVEIMNVDSGVRVLVDGGPEINGERNLGWIRLRNTGFQQHGKRKAESDSLSALP